MLKFVPDLSDDNEYAIVCWGQSNSRPLGSEDSMAAVSPELFGSNHGGSVTFADALGISLGGGVYLLTVSVGSLTQNAWQGGRVRLGTNTTPIAGYGKIRGNTANTVTVEWLVTPASAPNTQGYLVREDWRWASYPQVRVLTPYMPILYDADLLVREIDYPTPGAALANQGASLLIPGYTKPAALTGFQQMAVFLPYCNHEGINGYGESEIYDGAALASNPGDNATASTWVVANLLGNAPDGYFANGYLVVEWETGGVAKRSWARLANDATANESNQPSAGKTEFNLQETSPGSGTYWLGDGQPTAGYSTSRWTAWVPYVNDSPYAYNPGFEFSYPNNDFEPPIASQTGPTFRCRPRGITTPNYTAERVGAWINYAMRLSASIGKRINVILLGISGTSLYPSSIFQPGGFSGIWGWYNYQDGHDWDPTEQSAIFARFKELISPMAGYALEAEGNSKPLKVLAMAGIQGEGDVPKVGGREVYAQTLARFIEVLRQHIEDAGLSPYADGVRIPLINPTIAVDPNENDGADEQGWVNDGIRMVVGSDEFAATFEPDEAERDPANNIHYSGAGYAQIGAWLHEQAVPLIEYALSFGSDALNKQPTTKVDIWNLALSMIGEQATIATVDENSANAALCRQFYDDCRDQLLQARLWSFALRREPLLQVRKPDSPRYDHLEYCYVVPGEALCAFSVLPPDTLGDYVNAAIDIRYRGSEVYAHREDAPQHYIIETDWQTGVRLLFTPQANAVLRYTERVADAERYSPAFRTGLACLLGSHLAGAKIKGAKGEEVSARMLTKAGTYLREASSSDANQRNVKIDYIPDHLADRF